MAGRIALHVLASGSKGNAAIVENTHTGAGVLIDCGISKSAFLSACDAAGFDPTHLTDVLITHEHTDHVKGLGVVSRGLAKLGVAPTMYVLPEVADASKSVREAADLFPLSEMHAGDALSLAGMQVHVFATSHDAAGSCGFRFELDDDALGYLTDSGIVTGAAREALAHVRILALECNHDNAMLREGPYPYRLKQRIASDVGHLGNDQAAEELSGLLSDALEAVIAMHVSETNDTYGMARRALAAVLERESHPARAVSSFQRREVSVS